MASFLSNGINRWFGFKLSRDSDEDPIVSPILDNNADGSVDVMSDGYSLVYDIDQSVISERDLIDKYRNLSAIPEVRFAIENIVNEAIVIDSDEPVKLNVTGNSLTDTQRENVHAAWDNVMKVLDFKSNGYNIFERWYIDGKIYYYIIIDSVNGGIREVRQIDPKLIRKIRTIKKKILDGNVEAKEEIENFFLYSGDSIQIGQVGQAIKLSEDSVAYAHSGLIDNSPLGSGQYSTGDNKQVPIVKSYLHTALKPANQLQMLEEAVVIYRMVRAPERRAFYIDVDGLPNGKANQHMIETMNRFKNKTTYNADTGAINDGRRHMAMIEDFFLPRRNGKSTEITTLPGGGNLGEINDIDYFRDKLISALNVPRARFNADAGYQIGRSDTITRDEITFSKFITKLRTKFNDIFYSLLRVELVSSGIIDNDYETWDKLKSVLSIEYSVDNYFNTLKEIEIFSERISILNDVDSYVGKYFSKQHIYENILGMTQEEIDKMEFEIAKDKEKGDSDTDDDDGFGSGFGGGGTGDMDFGSEFDDSNDNEINNFQPDDGEVPREPPSYNDDNRA